MTADQPTPDAPDVATATLARLVALGEQRAALLDEATRVEDEARALVRERVAVGLDHDPARPVSQAAAADAVGVDRMTVRGWLGVRHRTRAARLASDG